MSKHTPGPWTQTKWITSQSRAVYKQIMGAGRAISAISVYGARKDGSKSGLANVSVEECEANARLIVAAPELLKALKYIVRDAAGVSQEAHLLDIKQIAREAIDLAEK